MWSKVSKHSKLNVIKLADLKQDKRRPAPPLFVTTQRGFDLDFLEYHMPLLLGSGTGWRSTAYANATVYTHEMNADWVARGGGRSLVQDCLDGAPGKAREQQRRARHAQQHPEAFPEGGNIGVQ